MTITRLAFFKLLGAVGIAQDFPYKRADGSPCKSHDIIAGSSTGGVCVPQECELKEGEERCPIGHCQKPQIVKLKQVYETAVISDPPFEQHVCFVCGICYVPVPLSFK